MARTRAARFTAVGALLVAGLAFAITALLGSGASTSSSAPGSSPATTARLASLGVQIESLNFGGVVIATVAPGSPAEAAGLDPGDVITQIDNRAINTASDVTAVLHRLHPGDQVEIQVSRGSATYTTQATLAARPPGHP
jgi:S1-C subfamily serine protease